MDYSGSTWVAQSALPRMGAPPDVVEKRFWRFVAGGHSAATGVAYMTRVVTTEKETTK
jgi:hypothetical protein